MRFLVCILFIYLSACEQVDEGNEYIPTSLEEQFFAANEWCGDEYASYSADTRVRTLFKVKPSLAGVFNISTMTLSPPYNQQNDYVIECKYLSGSQMRCSNFIINYNLNGNILSTDLLNRFFVNLNLQQLHLCKKSELDYFR